MRRTYRTLNDYEMQYTQKLDFLGDRQYYVIYQLLNNKIKGGFAMTVCTTSTIEHTRYKRHPCIAIVGTIH